MLKKIRYYFLFLFLGISLSDYASFTKAGEITYKWMYGNTYSITLTTYTEDGPSITDSCQDTLYFGDGTNAVIPRINGPLGSTNCGVTQSGEIIAPGLKKNIFVAIHTYLSPGSFYIYFCDWYRNNGIINIPNSNDQPFYIESVLTINSVSGPNSSSILTQIPLDKASLTKCFYHNVGSYDPDGDSLSYEIIPCKGIDALGTIGATIPGYSFPNPGTAGSFSINAVTGTVSWCSPQVAGEYNIAILIKEWRKPCSGSPYLIGYVERDMQIIVGSSSNSAPQFNSITDTCIVAGSTVNKNFVVSDPNTADLLTLTASGAPFVVTSSTATFSSTSSSGSATGSFNWQTNCSHVRKIPYTVVLKAIDNNGQVRLTDFKTYSIKVVPPPPTNIVATSYLNFISLKWHKPSCHPANGNKLLYYNIYFKSGASSWLHSSCETGVPAYSGFNLIGTTSSENDTSFVDYAVIGLANSTTCNYMVVAVYQDCSESYASSVASSSAIVGIKGQNKNENSVKIFPNPTSDLLSLTISSESPSTINVELFDIQGRFLSELYKGEVAGNSDILLNLADIESGTYIVKITGNNTNTHKTIIKL